MYVLDTNVYIAAQRNAAQKAALDAFVSREGSRVLISRVVLYELMQGASSAREMPRTQHKLSMSLDRRSRIIETDGPVWDDAAFLYGAIRTQKKFAALLRQPSFQNDLLIAASCRRVGATLISRNARDFAVINQVRSFRYMESLPA